MTRIRRIDADKAKRSVRIRVQYFSLFDCGLFSLNQQKQKGPPAVIPVGGEPFALASSAFPVRFRATQRQFFSAKKRARAIAPPHPDFPQFLKMRFSSPFEPIFSPMKSAPLNSKTPQMPENSHF
jgi:hypothetical protein